MHEFDEHTSPWSKSITDWLKGMVRRIALEVLDERQETTKAQKYLFSVDELCTELVSGESLSKRTVLNYIKEGNIEPLGIGPNSRKMYSIHQFEELWMQRAQNRAVVSTEPKSLSTGHTSGKMGRVLARMQSDKVA